MIYIRAMVQLIGHYDIELDRKRCSATLRVVSAS
jgi:hypothetical protein